METKENKVQSVTRLVLIAVAVGMAVASIVLGYLKAVDPGTQVAMLSLGLFTLSIAALQKS